MQPVFFEGSSQVGKPENMADEQCFSIWAACGIQPNDLLAKEMKVPPAMDGVDINNYPFFLTAWKPSFEDLQALNRGEPIYVKTVANGLPPMLLFTIDADGNCNDAD